MSIPDWNLYTWLKYLKKFLITPPEKELVVLGMKALFKNKFAMSENFSVLKMKKVLSKQNVSRKKLFPGIDHNMTLKNKEVQKKSDF